MSKDGKEKQVAYLANVRFPSNRAHSMQIAHMCQAFSNQGVALTLIVNKRRVSCAEVTSELLGFCPAFKIVQLSPKLFFPRIRFTFYIGELVFAINFLLYGKYKNFDVIYSRSEWLLYFLSYVIRIEKLVWESHEARLSFPAKRLLKNGVKTVVISDGIYEDYLKHGYPEEQLFVAYDGIDETYFVDIENKEDARKRLSLNSKKPMVMYIGGFDAWKGLDVFCQAAVLTHDLLFVVIGGKEEQVMTKRAQYPEVLFLGALPYKDLKHNQQAADILVVPNTAKIDLSAKYTSPLKLFAHMASGIPLVVSDVPSLVSVTGRELVTTFEPDNARDLVYALNNVILDEAKKIRKAKNLRTLSKKYTWQKRAKSILEFMGYTR